MVQQTFKALAALLLYPSEEQQKAAYELLSIIKEEKLLKPQYIESLIPFMDYLANSDIYEIQAAYINLFDRGRSHSLHLFEHIHGESRDRGQAMVDLNATYEAVGLHIDSNELPDFLPLFLEYLSLIDMDEALESLTDAATIIGVIGARLKEANSPYAPIFSSLISLSLQQPNEKEIAKAIRVKEDQSLEYLDDQWEEKPAFNGDADCNSCDMVKPVNFLTPEEIGAQNE